MGKEGRGGVLKFWTIKSRCFSFIVKIIAPPPKKKPPKLKTAHEETKQ